MCPPTHTRTVCASRPAPPPCDARPSRQRALMWRPRGESWRGWGPPSIGRPLPLSFLSRARVTLLNARLWCALGEPASLALHPRVRKGGEKAGSEGAEEGRRARRRPVPSPGCPRPLCTRPAPGQGPTSLRGARVQWQKVHSATPPLGSGGPAGRRPAEARTPLGREADPTSRSPRASFFSRPSLSSQASTLSTPTTTRHHGQGPRPPAGGGLHPIPLPADRHGRAVEGRARQAGPQVFRGERERSGEREKKKNEGKRVGVGRSAAVALLVPSACPCVGRTWQKAGLRGGCGGPRRPRGRVPSSLPKPQPPPPQARVFLTLPFFSLLLSLATELV